MQMLSCGLLWKAGHTVVRVNEYTVQQAISVLYRLRIKILHTTEHLYVKTISSYVSNFNVTLKHAIKSLGAPRILNSAAGWGGDPKKPGFFSTRSYVSGPESAPITKVKSLSEFMFYSWYYSLQNLFSLTTSFRRYHFHAKAIVSLTFLTSSPWFLDLHQKTTRQPFCPVIKTSFF